MIILTLAMFLINHLPRNCPKSCCAWEPNIAIPFFVRTSWNAARNFDPLTFGLIPSDANRLFHFGSVRVGLHPSGATPPIRQSHSKNVVQWPAAMVRSKSALFPRMPWLHYRGHISSSPSLFLFDIFYEEKTYWCFPESWSSSRIQCLMGGIQNDNVTLTSR